MKHKCPKCGEVYRIVLKKPFLGVHYRKECACGSSMLKKGEGHFEWYHNSENKT